MSEWTRKSVEVLLEKYKQYPCLYNVKSTDYHNKHMRQQALRSIMGYVEEIRPGATVDHLKKKINTLRSQYSAECGKIKESAKSGAGTNDLYTPRVWWFPMLDFMRETTVPRPSKTNVPPELYITTNISECEALDSDSSPGTSRGTEFYSSEMITVEQCSPQLFLSVSPSPQDTVPPSSEERTPKPPSPTRSLPSYLKKRKRGQYDDLLIESTSGILQNISKMMDCLKDAQPPKDENEAGLFGKVVASKLRKLSPHAQTTIQLNILKMFLEVEKENISLENE